MRGEDGVDESRLAQTGLADTDDIELEAALEELLLDLVGDAVETDVALGEDGRRLLRGCGCGHCECAKSERQIEELLQGKDGRCDDGTEGCKMSETKENSKWYTPRRVWGTGSKGKLRHARSPPPQSPRSTHPTLFPWHHDYTD